MSTFTLSDRYGRPFKVSLSPGSGNPGNAWQRLHFTPGQAGPLLQRFDSLQLEKLRKHFSYHTHRIAITSLGGLSDLFEQGALCIYKQSLDASSEDTATQDKQQTVGEMTLDIDGEFKKLLAIDSFSGGSGKSSGDSATGLVDSGANLKAWFAECNSVLSPLWHIKRQIENALDEYNRQAAENLPDDDLGLVADYLKRANIKDYRIIVKALGLSPGKIDADQFSEAWHSAWILVGDTKVSLMIRKFSLGYMGVQTHANLPQAKYGAAFEVLLAILLTTSTTAKQGKTAITNISTPYSGVFVNVAEQLLKISKQVIVRPGPFKSGTKEIKPPQPEEQATVVEQPIEEVQPKVVEQSEEPVEVKTWVSIKLIDVKKKAIANEEYEITTPDGKTHKGKTNASGIAKIDDIPEGDCKVSFPKLKRCRLQADAQETAA